MPVKPCFFIYHISNPDIWNIESDKLSRIDLSHPLPQPCHRLQEQGFTLL